MMRGSGMCVPVYNRKVGKPYNAADARHVDFPNFRGRGDPNGGGQWTLVVSDRA